MSPSNHPRSGRCTHAIACVLTALAVATSGCTSFYPVAAVRTPAGQTGWQVEAGENIFVIFQDGTGAKFKVHSVTPEHIISADRKQFEQASIVSMQRLKSDGEKTTALIVVTLLLFVVAGAAAASSITLGSPFGGGAPND